MITATIAASDAWSRREALVGLGDLFQGEDEPDVGRQDGQIARPMREGRDEMGKSMSRAAILKRMQGGSVGAFLFGQRVVGLSPDEIRKNLRYGMDADRDATWPLSAVDDSPLAAEVVRVTREGTR